MDLGQRIGVFGGTFDPVHVGHLAIAERALSEAELSTVFFIPAGSPRLKRQRPVASAKQRVEMVKLAVAGNPKFQVCEIEAARPGPTYTIDTLEELTRRSTPLSELFLIVGIDVLSQLVEWKSPDRILEMCRLLVMMRPGYSRIDWPNFYANHPRVESRMEVVESISVDISATELRRRITSELSLRGLVPEAVEEYIQIHGLYRGVSDGREGN